MALARNVPAHELEVGDIVSVRTAAGVRVTHRVAQVVPAGDGAVLRLRGDANRTVDPETYTVGSVYRVFWHVPRVGYAVALAESPVGLAGLGLLIAGLVLAARPSTRPAGRPVARHAARHAAGRSARRSSRRRAARAGAAVAVSAAAVAGPGGSASAAPWSDPVAVSADVVAHSVQEPDSTTCSASTPSATITWPEKDSRYDYEVQLKSWDGSVVSTKQVTGGAVSQTYSGASDFGLVVLSVGVYDYTVEIRSYLAASTSWRGPGVLLTTQKIRVSVVLVVVPVLGTVSCV